VITVDDAKRRAKVRLPSGNVATVIMVRRFSGRATVQTSSGAYANVWCHELELVTDADV